MLEKSNSVLPGLFHALLVFAHDGSGRRVREGHYLRDHHAHAVVTQFIRQCLGADES